MSFANPFGLALLASVAVLVSLYLRQRRRRELIVPSLLLWQELRPSSIRSRRFQPDWLFLLQLLALLALTGGLAQPLWPRPGGAPLPRDWIFVLDVTASTAARDGAPSRFDLLAQEASARLDATGGEDSIAVIAAGARPRVVLAPTRDRSAAVAAIRGLSPADTGGDLAQAMRLARDLNPVAQLHVLTDANGAAAVRQWPERVRPFVAGERDDNLGIAGLEVSQGRFEDPARASVAVQVRNHSDREQHGWLSLDVEGEMILRRGFTVAARASESFVVRSLPRPGRLRASLAAGDLLAADDVAYAWIAGPTTARVQVVAEPSAFRDDLLRLLQRLGLDVAAADPGAAIAATTELVLYEREVPAALPAANVLLLYPEASHLFRVAAEVESAEVLDWNQHHPIFTGIEPVPALPFTRARIIDPPEWADEVLWSRTTERQFPLAFTGQVGAHRVAVLAFDLRAEGLLANDRVDRVILLTAFLAWLLPPTQEAVVARAGEVISLEDGGVARIEHAGEHRVSSAAPSAHSEIPRACGAAPFGKGGEDLECVPPFPKKAAPEGRGGFLSERRLLVNFGDPAESDLGTVAELDPRLAQLPQESPEPPAAAQQPLQLWLYAAALVILCGEWLAARKSAA
ncbi:MAG TPA: BatA and WFA domain-containing protein [Terriglobales bacterium]|nr:BatA and WFA domain-containing protein [Terriglobales bacterium]